MAKKKQKETKKVSVQTYGAEAQGAQINLPKSNPTPISEPKKKTTKTKKTTDNHQRNPKDAEVIKRNVRKNEIQIKYKNVYDLGQKVKNGTATDLEKAEFGARQRTFLGNISDATTMIGFQSLYDRYEKFAVGQDYDINKASAGIEIAKILEKDMQKRMEYAALFDEKNFENVDSLYGTIKSAKEHLTNAKSNMEKYGDENEYRIFRTYSNFSDIKDLEDTRYNLVKQKEEMQRVGGFEREIADIDKRLGYIDENGYSPEVISSMGTDDLAKLEEIIKNFEKQQYNPEISFDERKRYKNLYYSLSDEIRLRKSEIATSEKWNKIVSGSGDSTPKYKEGASGDDVYDRINYGKSPDNFKTSNLPSALRHEDVEDWLWLKTMTTQEKEIYNRIYNKYGKVKADEYIEDITPFLNKRREIQRAKSQYEFDSEHPVYATLRSLATSPGRTIHGLGVNAANIYDTISGNEIDPYSKRFIPTRVNNTGMEAVKDQIDSEIGKIAYTIGVEVADLALNMSLASGVGKVAGTVSNSANALQIASKVSNVANQILLSSNSMLDTTLKYKESGESDLAAVGMGLLSGIIEAWTERNSLSRLMKSPDIYKELTKKEFAKAFTKKLGVDFVQEGWEEVEANILNSFAQLMLGYVNDTTFMTVFDKAIADGESESDAFNKALWAVGKENLEAFVVGGFAGLGFGGVNAISGRSTYTRARDSAEAYFGKNGYSEESLFGLMTTQADSKPDALDMAETVQKAARGELSGKEAEALSDNPVLSGVLTAYKKGYTSRTNVETESAPAETSKNPEYKSELDRIIHQPTLSNKNIEDIINNESAREEFQSLTGVKLDGTKAEMREAVKQWKLVEDYKQRQKDNKGKRWVTVEESNVRRGENPENSNVPKMSKEDAQQIISGTDMQSSLSSKDREGARIVQNDAEKYGGSETKGVSKEVLSDSGTNSRWETSSENENAKDIESLGRIVDFVRNKFGIPISTGNIRQRNARGIYKVGTEAIRTKESNNIPTIMHELGHHLDKKYGFRNMSIKELMRNCDQGFLNLYPENERPGEAIAEFVRTYTKNKSDAKQMSPMFYDEFVRKLDKTDLKNIQTLADMVNAYMSGDFESRAKAAIVSSKDAKKTSIGQMITRVRSKWIDKFQAQREAMDFVEKSSRNAIAPNKNAYKLAINSLNASKISNFILTKEMTDMKGKINVGKSFLECISNVKDKDLKTLDEYLVLRHSLDWLNPENPEDVKRVFADDYLQDTNRINQRIKEIESAHPEMKKAAQDLYEYQDNIMKNFIVAGGGMSIETYEELKQKYPNYVPFFRATGKMPKGFTKAGFANQKAPIRRAKGSGLEIISPLESIVNNTEKFVKFALRNEVMQVWADYADSVDGFGNIMERVPPDMVPKSVDVTSIKEMINSAVKEKFDGDDIIKVSSIIDDFLDDNILEFNPIANEKKKIIAVRNGDTTRYYQVHNEEFYKSISNMTPKQSGWVMSVLRSIMQPMKMLMTQVNPIFATTNIIRDIGTAYRNSDINNPIKFMMNYIGAIGHIIRKTDMYKTYLAMGGGNSSELSANVNDIKKTLRKIAHKDMNKATQFFMAMLHPVDMVASINDFVEQIPRVSEFISVMEKTNDVNEAIYRADDITTNFKRGGESGKDANQIFMFFNASVQGLDRLYRSFADATPKERGARIAKYAAVSIIMTALVQYWNRHDEEDEKAYERLSAYTKNNYYCFSIGDGMFIKIPKPREYAIFDSLTSNIVDSVYQGKDAFYGFGEYLALNLLPPGIPDTLKPKEVIPSIMGDTIFGGLVDVSVNRDFKGTPIESAADENLARKDRYSDKTSALAVWLGQTKWAADAELSPKQIDYLINSYSGIFGQVLTATVPSNSQSRDWTFGLKNKFTSDSLYSTDVLNKVYDERDRLQKSFESNNDSKSAYEYENALLKSNFVSQMNKAIKALPEEQRREGREYLMDILDVWDSDYKIDNEKLMKQAEKMGVTIMTDNKGDFISESLPVSTLQVTKDGQKFEKALTPNQYARYVSDYIDALNQNRNSVKYTSDDEYIANIQLAETTAKSNISNLYEGIIFAEDSTEYLNSAINDVANVFSFIKPSSFDFETNMKYQSKVYEFAKEKNINAQDVEYSISSEWMNNAIRLSDDELSQYLYGQALISKYGEKESKNIIMSDKKINDNIKMRLTSKSDSQDFDVYLRKYNITEGFWTNFTKKVDEIEPFKVGKKTISKQDQVISLINAQKMSDSQKSALYRAMGYSDELKSGSVQKKVPWKYHWDIATTDNFENKVGMKIVDTKHQGYTDRRLNDAVAGQCVWFVRGRAYEKLGKYLPAMGDANQMYASAKESARLSITKDNILPNTLVSYKVGTSAAGQKAGHVIYIEDVVGDTVYYTEGGYGSSNGVVKKSTKDNIMKGLSGNNSTIGTYINGIIDVTKY